MNAKPEIPSTFRSVVRVVRGSATSDGAGVRLMRLIGTEGLSELDPFLLLDQFGSDSAADYIAGFPEHPHRGFETVTYMLEGRMRHRDNQGNEGLLVSGSVQWMTAGRGIVHSEMPEQEAGRMSGFQLWVNLPAARKMTAPRYQDIPPEQIPSIAPAPGREATRGRGPIRGHDRAGAGDCHSAAVPGHHCRGGQALRTAGASWAYGVCVRVRGQPQRWRRHSMQESWACSAPATHCSSSQRAVDAPLSWRPSRLGEPVARYGPFVMNTRAEIIQAIEDFNAGRF